MIRYRLSCPADHAFESWFRDSSAFDEQSALGSVTCPTCGSSRVGKTVMAPAIVGGQACPPQPAKTEVALIDGKDAEIRGLLRRLRDTLHAEGHDVGPRFAVEARRIHEGEAPARQIYGEASIEEARGLIDEGIMVLPVPTFPDELN
jgi:hypothetical protein